MALRNGKLLKAKQADLTRSETSNTDALNEEDEDGLSLFSVRLE